MTDLKLRDYYAQRAPVLEQDYAIEEREDDLEEMEERVCEMLMGQKVLELACGTGYWTQQIADFAESVHATDFCPELLEIAQTKEFDNDNVDFALTDAFALPAAEAGRYSAGFAGFLWSHVRREDQSKLLKQWCAAIGSGSTLILIDDNEVEGETLPVARTDLEGNTFHIHTMADGSRVEVIKNFPTDSYMRKKFAAVARDIRIYRNEYYWMLSCVLR
jgi:SAM-dependent methyltransferase